jgi:hypothetical protein
VWLFHAFLCNCVRVNHYICVIALESITVFCVHLVNGSMKMFEAAWNWRNVVWNRVWVIFHQNIQVSKCKYAFRKRFILQVFLLSFTRNQSSDNNINQISIKSKPSCSQYIYVKFDTKQANILLKFAVQKFIVTMYTLLQPTKYLYCYNFAFLLICSLKVHYALVLILLFLCLEIFLMFVYFYSTQKVILSPITWTIFFICCFLAISTVIVNEFFYILLLLWQKISHLSLLFQVISI